MKTESQPHYLKFLWQLFFPVQVKTIQSRIDQDFRGADAAFQYLLIIFIGFLFPLLPLFSTFSTIVIVLICAIFVGIRFYIRPVYYPALRSSLTSLPSILFLLLLLYVELQAIRTSFAAGSDIGIFLNQLRPFLSGLLFFIIWHYFRTNLREPFNKGISALFLAGCSLFLLLRGLDIVKNYLIIYINGSATVDYYHLFSWTTDILKQNRSLECFTALVFLIPIHQKKLHLKNIDYLPHIFIFLALAYSIINTGNYGEEGYYVRHINSESVQAGLILSWAVFIMAHYKPRFTIHTVFSAILTFILLAPVFFKTLSLILEKYNILAPLPLQIRLEIWQYVSEKIMESPFLGHGVAYSKFVHSLDVYHHYAKEIRPHPHPHNVFLELWYDLGLVGILLVCSLIILAWKKAIDCIPEARPGFIATISVLFLLFLTTHSIWQSWWIGIIALVTLHLTLIPSRVKGDKKQ